MRKLQWLTVVGLVTIIGAAALAAFAPPPGETATSLPVLGAEDSRSVASAATTSSLRPLEGSSLDGATAVAAGYGFTCAVTAAGGVQCWGDNSYAQLGDGTSLSRGTPADVIWLTTPIVAVATGHYHACVLTSAGGVKCWGDNNYGQMGDGTAIPRATPTDVAGLSAGVTAITAGLGHTCALTAGGGVKCWGQNSDGQLGDGSTTVRPPVDVVGLTGGVVAVAAGDFHTCAVTTGGGVKCWGRNLDGGQLGDGTTTSSATPVDVAGLATGVAGVSAGRSHTCALTSTGGVKCWGSNAYGQLGDGTTTAHAAPADVVGLTTGVTALAAGDYETCAVTASGGVKCWGLNSSGQLGDGTLQQRTAPVDVARLAQTVTTVAAGWDHTCALTTDGGVQCWGSDGSGQIGVGANTRLLAPTDVVGVTTAASALGVGQSHTCVATTNGGVKCWGVNANGQLGDGTTNGRATPAAVNGLTSRVSTLALGGAHSCATTSAGSMACWGANSFGQLGDTTTTPRLTAAPILPTGMASVAAGYDHTCGVTTGGAVKCWGSNYDGQLGDGTTTSSASPGDVAGLGAGVVAVAAGYGSTCAVTDSGAAKCWGRNDRGQLGDGTTDERTTPVDVSGLAGGVATIVVGSEFACALTSEGGVKCWGANFNGQLGDGTVVQRTTPVDVVGLSAGVIGIAAGYSHACAVSSGGAVKCWGANDNGQIGDGTTTRRMVPVNVTGLSAGAATVGAGRSHTCAAIANGSVKCWGDNMSGQAGDGREVLRTSPVNTLGFGVTITLTNLYQAHDGTPKPVTVTTTPAGVDVTIAYAGSAATTYGPTSAPPSEVGTYAVFATVTDPAVAGSGSASATLVVEGEASNRRTVSDFDGDGYSDLAIYRPATGGWYSTPATASTGTPTATLWGGPSDIPVPADFDGDGTTDVAVFRPATGTWYALPSSDAAHPIAIPWGGEGDVPVPADFDGDGKADIAVYRPSTGGWYILLSTYGYDYASYAAVAWGGAGGDIPVPGDYDGDGRTDIGIYRPATGNWYILTSSSGYSPAAYIAFGWGNQAAGDVPMPGDYDGDGRTDICVWRAATGTWYILKSGDGYDVATSIALLWGGAGDVPVPCDYDGDGKTDIAVWRASTGTWYVLKSSDNYDYGTYLSYAWGGSSDVPLTPSSAARLVIGW